HGPWQPRASNSAPPLEPLSRFTLLTVNQAYAQRVPKHRSHLLLGYAGFSMLPSVDRVGASWPMSQRCASALFMTQPSRSAVAAFRAPISGSVQNLSHFRLAERHPALAHAVMAPLICWSFSNSMFRYLLVDHAVPAMWRSLAAARLSAD